MENRDAFYETAGCLRDVIENHLFQVVALLAMEPPAYRGFGAVQREKAKVFQAMRPLKPDDLVRGQYDGYRKEPNVATDSDVETFFAKEQSGSKQTGFDVRFTDADQFRGFFGG